MCSGNVLERERSEFRIVGGTTWRANGDRMRVISYPVRAEMGGVIPCTLQNRLFGPRGRGKGNSVLVEQEPSTCQRNQKSNSETIINTITQRMNLFHLDISNCLDKTDSMGDIQRRKRVHGIHVHPRRDEGCERRDGEVVRGGFGVFLGRGEGDEAEGRVFHAREPIVVFAFRDGCPGGRRSIGGISRLHGRRTRSNRRSTR